MRHTDAALSLAVRVPLQFITQRMRHEDIGTMRKHYARLDQGSGDPLDQPHERVRGFSE